VHIIIDEIIVGERKRTIDSQYVMEIEKSIREVGLIEPIVVTRAMRLVAGAHRLEAVRRLGWETIPAIVKDLTELEAELLEIDENLVRKELTVLERGEHLERRNEILRLRGERAEPGDNQHGGGETISPPRTTADLATEIGVGERSAQQAVQIARGIQPDVRDMIRRSELADSTTQLLTLARVKNAREQRTLAEAVLAGTAPNVPIAVQQLRRDAQRTAEVTSAKSNGRFPKVDIHKGDALAVLTTLPEGSVHCAVTSPPYWSMRDYQALGQLGLEASPEEHIERIVEVFREVRKVLRDDGTLWLNYGDCYVAGEPKKAFGDQSEKWVAQGGHGVRRQKPAGLKTKDLVGMAWRVAFALQADGWYLRSDIVWSKPNALPESVKDRPTKAHEYVFLLAKSEKYFFDAEAVREEATSAPGTRDRHSDAYNDALGDGRDRFSPGVRVHGLDGTRHLRSVWSIPTQRSLEAHFATFPEELVERCVRAGTSGGGCCGKCGAPRKRTENGWQPGCDCEASDIVPCVVLDPFLGSGTAGLVASRLGRDCVGIEINPKYVEIARRRIFGLSEEVKERA